MRRWSVLIVVLGFCWSACYYDSEEDLYGSANCNTTNVSFASDVNPIIVNHCVSCHFKGSNIGGGINLDGYVAVESYAKNNSLVGSVKHSGFSPMPKGQPKLDDCKISKIEAWVKAGSPNN
ncbi:MAG: hypothetical protein WAT46_01265 [Saprospiraceae bacterium]